MRAALDGLRMHRRGAILTALAGALAIAAALPVALLLQRDGASRLALAPSGDLLGFAWSDGARSVDALRTAGLDALTVVLAVAALATVAVAAITVLAIAGVRAAQRGGEIAVRRAVGASRARLLGDACREGAVVAGAALAAGLLLGLPLARLARAAWPGGLSDGTSAFALAAVGIVAGTVLLGALLVLGFAARRSTVPTAAPPLGLWCAAAQLGLALMVLASASLLGTPRAAERSTVADGATRFLLSTDTLTPADRSRRYAALLATFDDRSRYDSVTLVSPGALEGLGVVAGITTDCGDCVLGNLRLPWRMVQATHHVVSADTFRAAGLERVAGRLLTDHDDPTAPRVVVINAALAREHFQRGEAVGRRLHLGTLGDEWVTVVGVVRDAPSDAVGAGELPRYAVYLPALQHPPASAELVLRPRAGTMLPADTGARIAALVGAVRTVPGGTAAALDRAALEWFARGFRGLGAAMLLIAAAGAFALMRAHVTAQHAELGLRRATGAGRVRLLGRLLLQAALVGLGGTAFALWFGPALHGALQDALPGLADWSAEALVPLTLLLVGVSVLGVLLPAREALARTPAALLASADE